MPEQPQSTETQGLGKAGMRCDSISVALCAPWTREIKQKSFQPFLALLLATILLNCSLQHIYQVFPGLMNIWWRWANQFLLTITATPCQQVCRNTPSLSQLPKRFSFHFWKKNFCLPMLSFQFWQQPGLFLL